MEPGREVARRAIRRVHGWKRDYHFERTYLAFRSWFLFWSRSDRWCAIEPRGEGLGGGGRSQEVLCARKCFFIMVIHKDSCFVSCPKRARFCERKTLSA